VKITIFNEIPEKNWRFTFDVKNGKKW
jgi:hypothetical protein